MKITHSKKAISATYKTLNGILSELLNCFNIRDVTQNR